MVDAANPPLDPVHPEDGDPPPPAPENPPAPPAKVKGGDEGIPQKPEQVEGTSDGATVPAGMNSPVDTGYAFRTSTNQWMVKRRANADACAGGFTYVENWPWTQAQWPKSDFTLTMRLVSWKAGAVHKWHDSLGNAVAGPTLADAPNGNDFKSFDDDPPPAHAYHEVWRYDDALKKDTLRGYVKASEPGAKWTRPPGGEASQKMQCGDTLTFKWKT